MGTVFTIWLLVGVVYGQTKNCCFPDQWEGSEGIISGSSSDEGHSSFTVGSAKISFDAKGKQVHISEELKTGNDTMKLTILQLYEQNVEFIIENQTCTRIKLGSWSDQNCIPDIASRVGPNFTFGLKQHIIGTAYTWNIETRQVTMSVTDDCVPLGESITGTIQGVNVMTGARFEGITKGISDPSIFDVPDICKSAKESEAYPHIMHRGSFLFKNI